MLPPQRKKDDAGQSQRLQLSLEDSVETAEHRVWWTWERNCEELKQDLNPRTPLVKEGKAHSTGVGGHTCGHSIQELQTHAHHGDIPTMGDTPTASRSLHNMQVGEQG